jgi:periplasmic protein TonB
MTLSIFLVLALIIFLFSVDQSWSNVVSSKRNNMVFEGRNQDYGAFALRREHHVNVFKALFISLGLIGAGLGLLSLGQTSVSKASIPFVNIINLPPLPPAQKDDAFVENKPDQPQEQKQQAVPPSGNNQTTIEVVAAGVTSVLKPMDDMDDGSGVEGPKGPAAPGPATGGTGISTGTESSAATIKIEGWSQQLPVFPGGPDAMMAYISKKVEYSELARQNGTTGTILVSFVVTPTGELSNIKIERTILNGRDLEKQIIKAIEQMPRWTPGFNNGIPVYVRQSIPVRFTLKD